MKASQIDSSQNPADQPLIPNEWIAEEGQPTLMMDQEVFFGGMLENKNLGARGKLVPTRSVIWTRFTINT